LHVGEHFRPACLEKSDEKQRGYGKEDDVQNSRVIEGDRRLDDSGAAVRRDQPQKIEKELDHQRGNAHGDIKNDEDKAGDLPAVILPIDVDDGQNNQVSINECDNAAEADAAIPQYCSQGNVAYRTDE